MTDKERNAQLQTLDAAYRKALYATPRDEALCLRLAEETLLLVQGTPLESGQRRKVERHQSRGPSQLRKDLGLA